MRIIDGEFGSRKLKTVPDNSLRPAMGKTREALFSMLEAGGIDWSAAPVLDLFAGCGSLGLECLSRGSPEADFVENAQQQYECIRQNAAELGVLNRCGIYRQDVLRFLRQPLKRPYQIIFLDPPYGKNLVKKCLEHLVQYNWLKNRPIIIAEVEKYNTIQFPEILGTHLKRDFGQTSIHIWNFE